MIAGFIFLLFSTIFGFMKSSEPYKVAMTRANASAEVRAALGAPIESGMMVSGSISTSGSEGSANFAIPIFGPGGKGSIHLKADKSSGRWTYKTLEVEIPGQPDTIDLRR